MVTNNKITTAMSNPSYGNIQCSSISGINTNITTGANNIFIRSSTSVISSTTFVGSKIIYNILGEDFEYDGFPDTTLAIIISSINVMGKPFYDDLKKQGVYLNDSIIKFLNRKFKELERENKLQILLK